MRRRLRLGSLSQSPRGCVGRLPQRAGGRGPCLTDWGAELPPLEAPKQAGDPQSSHYLEREGGGRLFQT